VLLGISKRGDRYLRTLLIHGARSALCRCKTTDSKYGEWLTNKKASLSLNKAAVALANKNARIIWVLLKTGKEFDCNQKMVAA
jgi:transposase